MYDPHPGRGLKHLPQVPVQSVFDTADDLDFGFFVHETQRVVGHFRVVQKCHPNALGQLGCRHC